MSWNVVIQGLDKTGAEHVQKVLNVLIPQLVVLVVEVS